MPVKRNWKGLGWRQQQLVDHMGKFPYGHHFSIHKGWRKVALSLQKRGIIKIVNDGWTNWTIRRA